MLPLVSKIALKTTLNLNKFLTNPTNLLVNHLSQKHLPTNNNKCNTPPNTNKAQKPLYCMKTQTSTTITKFMKNQMSMGMQVG